MPKISKLDKNVLFDPLALKNSGLFKKVSDNQIEHDEAFTSNIRKKDQFKSTNKILEENDNEAKMNKSIDTQKDATFDDVNIFNTKKNANTENKIEDNLDELFKPMKSNILIYFKICAYYKQTDIIYMLGLKR